jgi:NADH-quinone oxidoreductase subunit N
MTGADVMALMPLVILAAGSVLVLLAGAFRPGGYLYEAAGCCAAASLAWCLLIPLETVLPGLSMTPFSRVFICLTDGCGILVLLLASCYNRRRGIVGEEFPATLLFALAGMAAAVSANNLLMLFLALESFTFAFYILVAIERGSPRGGEAGLKYLLNGTLSAAIMALGMALLYCSRGTLRLAELLPQAGGPPTEPLFMAGAALLLLGLAFKLSLVPAHLWTADVYQGAPAPVTALLSTASKAASVAVMVLIFPVLQAWQGVHDILWLLALFSLLAGNLAALLQTSLKRLLAWSSVGQMGYVALALVAFPAGGGRAALFYVVIYAIAGLAAFAALSAVSDGSDRDDIDEYAGLGYRSPLAGAALALAMFSLAGIPPAAGFMAKFTVFAAALRAGETVLALTGILTALVAVFFYLRVVVVLYMKSPGGAECAVRPLALAECLALVIPMTAIVALGVYPSPLLELLELMLR